MTSRQRGAALLLAALVAGRILDRFDLPFEATATAPGAVAVSGPAAPDSGTRARVALAARVAGVAGGSPAAPDSTAATGAAAAAPDPDHTIGPSADGVHINRASAADLQRLPGVGPVLAERIVADRAAHGPFRDAADLQRVRGIGPKSVTRLAPRLRFD